MRRKDDDIIPAAFSHNGKTFKCTLRLPSWIKKPHYEVIIDNKRVAELKFTLLGEWNFTSKKGSFPNIANQLGGFVTKHFKGGVMPKNYR